jgi:membrane protease YdiL (CAAX protease family)
MSDKATRLRQLFIFLCCWFGGTVLSVILVQLVAKGLGIGDFGNLISKIIAGEYLEHINNIKIISIISHLAAYSIPAIVFANIISGKNFHRFLKLDKNPGWVNLPLIIVAIFAIYPTALWIAYLNIQLLPANMIAEDTLIFQQRLMQMNNPSDMMLNILLVGFVASIGEELLFRGIIQRFFARYSNNFHLAIWATALLFSLTHFQPEGFIPRFLMGALLGYFFVWTGSLWASILAHFCFNSMQVLIFYFFVDSKKIASIYQKPDFSLLLSIILTGIFIFACYILWKINRDRQLKIDFD